MLKTIAASAASMLAACGLATAQNSLGGGTSPMIESLTANDIVQIMQQAGLTATFTNETANGAKYVEVTNGAATFYVALRSCAGAGATAPCQLMQPFGFFDASGVVYAQLNAFNMNISRMALAGFNETGEGLVGGKIYLNSGVSYEHFLVMMDLFLNDVDSLLSGIQPGARAQVNYDLKSEGAPLLGMTIAIADEMPDDWRPVVNATGRAAPKFMTDGVRALTRKAAPQP